MFVVCVYFHWLLLEIGIDVATSEKIFSTVAHNFAIHRRQQDQDEAGPSTGHGPSGTSFLGPTASGSMLFCPPPGTKRGRGGKEDKPPERGKKPRLGDTSRQKNTLTWACPFYLYSRRQYRPCLQHKLSRIVDVRTHILRKHRQASHCPNCGCIFPNDSEDTLRNNHIREQSCQRLVDGFSYPGATADQWSEITAVGSARRQRTDEQRWFEIWGILFPESPPPESPFVTSETAQVVMDCIWQFSEEGHIASLVDESLGGGCALSRQMLSNHCRRVLQLFQNFLQQQEQEQESGPHTRKLSLGGGDSTQRGFTSPPSNSNLSTGAPGLSDTLAASTITTLDLRHLPPTLPSSAPAPAHEWEAGLLPGSPGLILGDHEFDSQWLLELLEEGCSSQQDPPWDLGRHPSGSEGEPMETLWSLPRTDAPHGTDR